MKNRRPWKEEPRELDERDFELMRLPLRYWDSEWAKVDFEGDKAEKTVLGYRENLRESFTRGMGLYIWGPLGSGKTALGALILRSFRSHGQSALFARSDLLLKSRFNKIAVSDDRPDLWAYARAVSVLMVDDFGKSFQDGKGFSDMEFESLLRDRYDNRLVTLVTSNLSPSKLMDEDDGFGLKPSTASVLQASMIAVNLAGKDHRKEEMKQDYEFFTKG